MASKIRELQFRNFNGGLNTRDNPSEIAPNEIPDAINVTIDDRGGAQKRLGYVDRFGAQVGTGLVSNLFYWATRGWLVEQIGTGMHVNNGAAFLTWSTSARCGMTEFLGNLILIHPVDGMRIYDGTTVTSPAGAPAGSTVATWQNRVWASQVATPRIWYSAIGDPTSWPGTNWVDIREKNSGEVVCLAGAGGLDVSGRPGLLAFKQDSAYRIYDSATGAYNTIDPAHGAASNISAVSVLGRTYVVNTDGIFSTDGLEPLELRSGLIENIFHKDQINQNRPDLFAAGRFHNRLHFSIPKAGETANSISFELEPTQGWIMRHTNAASAYAAIGDNVSQETAFGSPSAQGRIYNMNVGGSDAGAAITSRLQTYWLEPNGGNKTRIRRARFVGLGSFSATLLSDFSTSQGGISLNIVIDEDAPLYDAVDATYDGDDVYGPTAFQAHRDFWSLGVYRQVSVLIEETSSLTTGGRTLIDGITAPEQGAWTLAYVSLLSIDLGFH